MAARIAKADVTPPDRGRIEARYAEQGLRPYSWGNGPGDRYGWHTHGHTKVLCWVVRVGAPGDAIACELHR